MGRADSFDPVGLAEIAAMIGESKQNTRYIMDRRVHREAPAAVPLARGKVWKRTEVVKYLRAAGRQVTEPGASPGMDAVAADLASQHGPVTED